MNTGALFRPWTLVSRRIASEQVERPSGIVQCWRSWGGAATAAVAAGIAGVTFDASTPDIISVGIFYVGLVLAGFWIPNHRAAVALALLATPLIIAGHWIAIPDNVPAWQAWLNRGLSVGSAWVAALFVWHIRRLQEKLRLQIEIANTLSREINHRVGNNLQLVSSFLNLQARRAGNEEARRALASANSRVMVIAKIQRLLSHSTSADAVGSKAFIMAIVSEIRSALPDPKQVEVDAYADSTELDTTTAMMLGALLLEFTNNALKHAFPDDMKGKLTLGFTVSNDQYIVEFEDDGVGVGQECMPNGFGAQTIADLARLMRASVTCRPARQSSVRPGTRWRLVIPAP